MNANDMSPGHPEDQEPLAQLLREVHELAGEVADRVSNAEVDAALERLLGKVRSTSSTPAEQDPADVLRSARLSAEEILATAQREAREIKARAACAAAEAAAARAAADRAIAEAEQLTDAALSRAASIVATARQQAEAIIADADETARQIVAAASFRAGQAVIRAQRADLGGILIGDQSCTGTNRVLLRELVTCESGLDRSYLALLLELASDRRAAAQRRQVADALIGSSLQQIADRLRRLALAEPVRRPVDMWATVNGETWSFQVKFHKLDAVPEEPTVPSRRKGFWARLMLGQTRHRSRLLPALGTAGILVARRIPVAVRPPIDVDVLPVLYARPPKTYCLSCTQDRRYSRPLNEVMPGPIWVAALSPGTTGEAISEQSGPPQDGGDAAVGTACFASGCGPWGASEQD